MLNDTRSSCIKLVIGALYNLTLRCAILVLTCLQKSIEKMGGFSETLLDIVGRLGGMTGISHPDSPKL